MEQNISQNGKGIILSVKTKKPIKINKSIQDIQSNTRKMNWGQILVNDMTQFIDLIQKNPVQYDFEEVNKFIKQINKSFNLSGNPKDLNELTQEEYQQILRILVHKANDDHTGVYFYIPQFLYAGFTAIFDIHNSQLLFPQEQEQDSCNISSDSQPNKSKDQSQTKILKKQEISKLQHQYIQQNEIRVPNVNIIKNNEQLFQILTQNQKMSFKQKSNELKMKYTKQMRIIVDIVHDVELAKLMNQGDIITHINGEKAYKYLERVSQFCHRQTNSLLYNMQKSALMLGMFNIFFPVKTIQIKHFLKNPVDEQKIKSKNEIITLKYKEFNNNLNFNDVSFYQYLRIHMQRKSCKKENYYYPIEKEVFCLEISSFSNNIIQEEISKIWAKIYKKKQTIKLLVIDLRGNTGGFTNNVHQLLLQLINKQFADYIYYADTLESLEPEYLDKFMKKQIANILNKSDLTNEQKELKIQGLQEYKQYLDFIYSQNKQLELAKNTNKPQLNNKELHQMQINNGKQVLEGKQPGIVLITNYICKSSCSVFSKLLSLFPSTIVIGKEVQGFNSSGNAEQFTTSSQQAVFILPTQATIFDDDIAWFFKTTLYPNIYIRNKDYPNNALQFQKLIKQHKNALLKMIYQQCRQIVSQ